MSATLRTLPGFQGQLYKIAPWVILAHVLVTCWTAANSGQHWVAMLYDDFFYYMKVAENFADGNGSTYNQIVPTNGYHPLWMLILSAGYALFGGGEHIFYFVCFVCLISTWLTFHFVRRIATHFLADPIWATILAIYVSAFSLRQYFTGMEAILCIPLSLAYIDRIIRPEDTFTSSAKALMTGGLGSLVILSRLDAAILVGLTSIVILLKDQDTQKSTSLLTKLSFCAGLLPVPLYMVSNLIFFETLMPVSGMAKQLMPRGTPSGAVMLGIWQTTLNFRVNVLFSLLSTLALCFSPLGLKARLRWLMLACLAFPWIYFMVLSFLSDWCLSDWYLYPFRISVCLSGAIWLGLMRDQKWMQLSLVKYCAGAAVMFVLLTTAWRVKPGQLSVYQGAAQLHEFEATHPGIYAMGDRAGKVGYVMNSPVIHLEGLVMDKAFLAFMKRKAPLMEVLENYKVDYYIASSHEAFTGCFQAVEPYQAGSDSPKLRGEVCAPPLTRFTYGGVETLVYQIKR